MTRLTDILASAKGALPEAHVRILAEEVERLAAELATLKAGRLMVPEPTDFEINVHLVPHGYYTQKQAFLMGHKWACKTARAISPSDILQPGQVAVDREVMEKLRRIVEQMKADQTPEAIAKRVEGYALDALRSRKKEGER